MLLDFRRNLMIRHLVNGFHAYDASTEVGFLEPLLQFTLGLTWAEDQNRFGITSARNDRIVVDIEISCKPSLAAVICWYLLGFMGTFKRRITRATAVFFGLRYD